MNILNEIVSSYPQAISFAPGRPLEQTFKVESHVGAISRFAAHMALSTGQSPTECMDRLGQYGKTNGIILDLLSQLLARDEDITVDPESIMVTSGCQEAMAILLMGLFDVDGDVLLVSNPTYIGITGIAHILGIAVAPIRHDERGLDLAQLCLTVENLRRRGKQPKALYHIPDFNNPLGTSMSVESRVALLDVAQDLGLLLIEDNPYGSFFYHGRKMPTLKSLDREQRVIYLGTFSKTLFPGLRVGYLVADQPVEDLRAGRERYLAQELSRVKSFVSVNTSPILQGIVGGVLLESRCSLQSIVAEKRSFYRERRDHMLDALQRSFGPGTDGSNRVRWSRPDGGFFLTVELPFAFDVDCMRVCASEYGVIGCPMSFFTLEHGRSNQLRLSFSYTSPADIAEGVDRLASFVREKATCHEVEHR